VTTHHHQLLKEQLATIRYVILILDEVDRFLEHENSEFDAFFYTLSRTFANVCAILLTNRVSIEQLLLSQLDSRVKDTFRWRRVEFTDYNAKELNDILTDRCRVGLKENSYNPGIVAMIARLSYVRGLRGRGIIDITKKAGEIAEAKGHDRITEDDIREASSEDEDMKIVRNLPPIHKAILNQISTDSPTLGRLYDPWFLEIPEEYNVGKLYTTLRGYVQELDTLGLIEKEIHGRGRGRSTETRLQVPAAIAAAIRRSLADPPPTSAANVTPGDHTQ
jgi:cell division control protein 6